MLRYDILAKNNSMYNTPPTFAKYVSGVMFKWVIEQGDVDGLEKKNIEKSKLVYNILDNSSFYKPFEDKKSKSHQGGNHHRRLHKIPFRHAFQYPRILLCSSDMVQGTDNNNPSEIHLSHYKFLES